MKYIFTSEAVTEGHPDKVADRIADSILDELIKQDANSRVACEVVTSTNLVFIFGQITSQAHVNYEQIARDTVKEIGYTKHEYQFSYDAMKVMIAIDKQSPDIAIGVDEGENKELGAGDQGIMFGFASDETKELMPLGEVLAQKLAQKLTNVRKDGILNYLRPDGKTQVSIEYEDGKPKRIDTVLISCQHDDDIPESKIKEDIIREVINKVLPKELVDDSTKVLVNPTGRFVIGGPAGDTGLTGRKNITDTYGGYARNGGGSFSGKDPTKVDRSASYMLRYVAKNIVAANLAKKVEIQISYAIGVSKPISVYANTFGTGILSDDKLVDVIKKEFDLTPSGIIKTLSLKAPIYKETSCYGHFGREEKAFPWERLDKVQDLKKYLS